MKKIDLLGYKSPFHEKRKASVTFVTCREPLVTRNQDGQEQVRIVDNTLVTVPGVDRINIPRTDSEGKVVKNEFGEIEFEEATIVHVKGANSIFADEVMDQMKMKSMDDLLARAEDVVIAFNEKVVPANDSNTIAYMRACNYNRDAIGRRPGPPLFYEFDVEVIAQKRVESELPSLQVLDEVNRMVLENRMRPLYAMYSFVHKMSISDAMKRVSEYAVKDYMIHVAKTAPQLIADIKTNPKKINTIYLLQAFYDKVLSVDHNGVVRDKTGKEICVVGQGGDLVSATFNQITPLDMEAIRKQIGPMFAKEMEKETELITKLKEAQAQIEKLQALVKIGENLDPEKLKNGAFETVPKDKIENFVKGLLATDVITKESAGWLRGKILPDPSLLKEGKKAWKLEELTEFLYDKQEHFVLMVREAEQPV